MRGSCPKHLRCLLHLERPHPHHDHRFLCSERPNHRKLSRRVPHLHRTIRRLPPVDRQERRRLLQPFRRRRRWRSHQCLHRQRLRENHRLRNRGAKQAQLHPLLQQPRASHVCKRAQPKLALQLRPLPEFRFQHPHPGRASRRANDRIQPRRRNMDTGPR